MSFSITTVPILVLWRPDIILLSMWYPCVCVCRCCTENFHTRPCRTTAFHMCGKTYYGCHHLFNKQFGSWFMQWIANGAAATKFKSPVWFMAVLLAPQLIGHACISYKQGGLPCWEWVTQVDLIISEVFFLGKWEPGSVMVPAAACFQSLCFCSKSSYS